MNELRGYKLAISQATGETDPAVIGQIEEHMRDDIFHSTLDWQTRAQFNKGARQAYMLWTATHPAATDEQIIRAHYGTKKTQAYINSVSPTERAQIVARIRSTYEKMRAALETTD